MRRERETETGLLSLKKSQNNNKAKIKKIFVSHTRPTVRKRCNVATRNIFWVICDNFFSSSFWLPEIVIGSSDIVPEFTFGTGLLINEKNPLLDFEGTRYVNEL